MTGKTIGLEGRLYDYYAAHAYREPEILTELRAETARLGGLAQMQIGPEQGAFMAMVVKLMGAKRILELGTFTGYSSLAMALTGDVKIIAADVSEEWTNVARKYWKKAGVDGRIELRIGPAAETLEQLLKAGEASRFDLMFIDADKTSYDIYYEGGLKLLRAGGVMLIDNVLWSGSVADPSIKDEDTSALRALNTKIMADARVDLVMVPICDGVTMARKK
ncbi:MAG TPA: class I SAM-dependent methyltransferase [Aestuariivirga sp.]|jgi:predicted O-methyltransferase YrrM